MINRQNGNFTVISNKVISNPLLSAKAKGIYIYLQSKPDGWQFYEIEIINNFTDGKRSIRAGIQELIDLNLKTIGAVILIAMHDLHILQPFDAY